MKNIKVHFKTRNAQIETVEAPEFNTVMEASRYFSRNGYIDNIDADCGGECSCATCHVMVNADWTGIVGGPNDAEDSMLDLNPERATNSRLSCQMTVSDNLDGLVVDLPEFQF